MGAAASPAEVNFAWLIRLRWATIAAQAVTIAIVRFGLHIEVPIGPLYAICAVSAAANLGFALGARSATPREFWLLAVVAVDVVSLTGLLYFAGGPENPFSFLYLVPIAVGAITLRPASTWVLVLLSLAASAVLFTSHQPLALGGDHAQHMAAHLRGMWIAFGIAAAFIVYFLMRVRRALAVRDEELAASRNLAARQERLASLATLAAGAAHELATPLSTIAVVAKDLERDVQAAGVGPNAADDVRLMRREVDRCRRILERMRVDAGESAGERFVPVAVRDLVSDCLGPTAGESSPASGRGVVDVEIEPHAAALTAVVPRRAFGQVLRGLLDNARDASPPGTAVSLRVRAGDGASGRVTFEVADRGAGIPAEVLGRVGEPFFTTKPPGKGMGLGVFLARAVVERLGGEVAIQSARGVGTTATVSLPLGGDA
jgi:two-component system sensor histidine kinase RegB